MLASSSNDILDGEVLPEGFLERESGARFLTPGMCIMEKRYFNVFSLRLLSLLFVIWSSVLSPKIRSSGLWSTATVRSWQPKTKCLDFSRASATASASPSMGAYLDSAGWVNRLPTRVTLQPSLQQNRSLDGHAQCFWNNQKPMPSFDQSVARHVGLVLSKIETPVFISLTMYSFDLSNVDWRSSVQANLFPGLSSVLKGSMASAMLNEYET